LLLEIENSGGPGFRLPDVDDISISTRRFGGDLPVP
jgi:hypothetical protein